MKKSFKRKLAAWVGILFVITQIIPARTINATTEEEENKKYGTIEHYNGILFGDDNLVSYDNKNYAYISKGGDNEGAVAVGGDMHVPYLDNSMDFGASAASGYTGIGSKYEDNGMLTVMTSGKWDKINGSNITVYGSRVLLAQEDNQGFTVTGSDVEYSTRQNIKNAISKFKSKVSNTIGYIEGIETNGIFEDNLYGKNIITNNEKNIVKVKLDSGIIPSLDLKGSVDLDKQYVIYSNAKDIKFSGGSVRYDGADVWGSSLPKDSPLFKIASNFIWVFPNAETVEINNYAVIGSVVAPKAKVHGNGSSVNGQLFASSLHQEGGFELHNFTSRWNWDLDSKGSIEIEKVDSKNSSIKLSGAVFEVYDSEEKLKGTITTDSQGKGSLGNLEYGEYTLVEKTAPVGYVLFSDRVTVNVNSQGITYKTITNTKILGKISILKVDSTDADIKLPGAVFEVKDSEGTVVDTITTGENGVGTSKELPYGNYTVTEVSAPPGYELSGESKNVTIDSNGQTIGLTFENTKLLGSISIEKVDSKDSEIKLKGAEFKVLNSDGEEVGNIVTGEDGKGSLGNLPYGEYTLMETKAPDGYKLSLDLIVVEVNSETEVYKTITNTKILGKISILKVDSIDEDVKLLGAVFEVKDSEGTVVDTITTGENGVGTSKELPYGNYTVTEVSAPPGYELSGESKDVTIDSNGQTIELTFKNSKLLGSISIEKVDSEDSELKLEGAEFKVINSDGEEVGNIVTGEDGKGSLGNLPYGEYTLMETKAPDGYELSLDLIVVEVNSKAVVYKTITNTKILGKISILKVDSTDADIKLPGAVFEIKDSEGTVVDTITTGENGVGTSKELPYGSYTVTEVSAPTGYELSEESKNVTINSNGQTIELTFKNSKLLGSISIEKVDSKDSELKLEGAEFKVINSDGEEVGNIVTGEDGKGSLGNLPYGEYTLMETKAPDGYELSLDLIVVEVNSETEVYKTITNTKILGKISILKVDSDDEDVKLSGAVFEVKDSQGTVVDTITTGENGVGTSKELPYGSYTVAEVSAPEGYELSEESKNVTIDSNGQTIGLTFENTKILGNISILKVDSIDEDVKLSGAVFEVNDSEGTVVDTVTTDENGVGTSKELPYGSYTVTEVTAPTGYELSEESKNVTIDSNGETIELTFENTKLLGSILIEKVDSEDSELKLEGAEFKVINSNGEEVGNIVTGEDGKGSLGNLPYGEYTLIETKAPDGYELSLDLIVVEVNSETEVYKTITNTKILGKINILKVDSDDEDVKLSGAVFEVKDFQGTVVDTITTDENGVGTSKELPYGSYTVTELTAPTGYELSEESKNVTIDSNGQTIALTFENTKILGKISILKVDSADENVKLPGAVFEVKDSEGTVVDTITTDENGVGASKELPYGSYTLTEVTAPTGYELSEESKNVTIDSNGQTIELTFENTKILGKISILKVDSIDESIKLSGAEFEIRDLEGNILDTLITNEEGVANSIQLPYGSYIVIETKAPEGYVLNDFSENVTINNENLEILLKVENIKEELLPEDPKEPEVPSKEDNEKEPVKTGDESGNIGGLGLMSLLSLIAMLLMHKKK
ncbi:SpaA isopeptide-forming pilin-related protein [Clostridium paraputrificum]|uniref:SpaA isopeptide-forming pilin-related protein n=2 Tax=Clostridium TaxID=1485 RepID=UPI000C07E533|nr:SpaA isopeptide-forming pilin-related protein [Clostridium paraputrificum]